MLSIKKYILIVFLLFFLTKISFAAQIVCIDTGTFRPGINERDDIVEVQEGNVELSGAGYANFKIINAPALTKPQIINTINENKIEKTKDPNSDIEYWFDSNSSIWYKIKKKPKHQFSFKKITPQDIIDLNEMTISIPEMLDIIRKVQDKIPLDPNNVSIIRARRRRNIINASIFESIKQLFWFL